MKVSNAKVLAKVCIKSEKWNGGANGPRQMFDDIFSPVDAIQERDGQGWNKL